ncbi:glycosyltransferase [Candidatus Methylocalor cossyra]|uniref:Uncharacterized protein n=1 Tax=Candidatus Methylocalor cossyra TaxID=3108543 RepID=A0ABP1C4D4_9GAMM
MRILHIFHHDNLKNGVDKTTATLIVALKKLGVDSLASVPAFGEVTEFLEVHGIQYRILPFRCCSSLAERARLRFFADASAQQELLRSLVRAYSPDLLHINTGHLLHAGLAAAQCQLPTVWHIHAPFPADSLRYEDSVGTDGYAWLLERLSTLVIGVSEDVCRSLTEYLPHQRVRLLYNGIDGDAVIQAAADNPVDIRQALGIPRPAKLVIGVGRISAQKDFAAFARVAGLVSRTQPDTYFLIAGPKQETEAVLRLDQEIDRLQLGERVFLLGPRSDIPGLIAQADLLLSTANYEGQGLAALEAMALGKPVVAMACQGLRECITHEHDGLLVNPGDEAGAAQAVQRLLDDPELARQLGANGRRSVQGRFSSNNYARQFLTIAEAAVSQGPAPITPRELALIQGLLRQIDIAHQRLASFEQQTIVQQIKLFLWKQFHRLRWR